LHTPSLRLMELVVALVAIAVLALMRFEWP
jgi:hypothetical protein